MTQTSPKQVLLSYVVIAPESHISNRPIARLNFLNTDFTKNLIVGRANPICFVINSVVRLYGSYMQKGVTIIFLHVSKLLKTGTTVGIIGPSPFKILQFLINLKG